MPLLPTPLPAATSRKHTAISIQAIVQFPFADDPDRGIVTGRYSMKPRLANAARTGGVRIAARNLRAASGSLALALTAPI